MFLKVSSFPLFVDDFVLCLVGKLLSSTIRRIQLYVKSMPKWVYLDLKFSLTVIECMHLNNQRGVFTGPDINLDGTSMEAVDEAKFSGMVFDL